MPIRLARRRFLAGASVLALDAAFGPLQAAGTEATIFVTSNDWHSGIALARADLPSRVFPEAQDFPGAPWLEFGWGDRDYYPAKEKTLGLALGAAFGSSPAVLHLAGLSDAPDRFWRGVESVGLSLAPRGFAALVAYLDASFERAGVPRAAAIAPGLYDFSRFYPATGRFSLFNTCNTWTARGLATAGLTVTPDGTQRAEDLMVQVRALPGARVIPPSR